MQSTTALYTGHPKRNTFGQPFLEETKHLSTTATVTLLGDGELYTLALREGNPGLVLANDENVAETSSESVVDGILDVDDIETTIVALTVSDNTNTTHIATTSDHNNTTGIERNELGDLAGLEINLDGVVDLDGGVRVTDGAGIVGDEVRNTLGTELDTADLAEFIASLLLRDTMDGEATFGVVNETEVLASLLNGDDIHETSREGGVSADLAVDLDEPLHDDGLGLATVQRILEPVADEDNEGHALAGLVGTGARLGGIFAGKLVEQPVGGRCKALEMFLRSAAHIDCGFVDVVGCGV